MQLDKAKNILSRWRKYIKILQIFRSRVTNKVVNNLFFSTLIKPPPLLTSGQSLTNRYTCAVPLERLRPLDPGLTHHLPPGLAGSGVDGCSHTRCGRLLISSGGEERSGEDRRQERGVEM